MRQLRDRMVIAPLGAKLRQLMCGGRLPDANWAVTFGRSRKAGAERLAGGGDALG